MITALFSSVNPALRNALVNGLMCSLDVVASRAEAARVQRVCLRMRRVGLH